MNVIPAAMHRFALRTVYPFALAVWRVTHPRVRGAYVQITRARGTPDEAWLFVENTYKPGLTLPGGGIGRRESPVAAARRETAEEVGLEFDTARFEPRDTFEIEYLHRHDQVHFFEVALGPDEQPPFRADGREIGWAGFVRRDALRPDELVAPVRRFIERRAARGD